ncbi:hypothetical protein KCU88_g3541, partial [Aureobasidium melanogenum]
MTTSTSTSTSPSPYKVLFILGGGPRIGHSVAKRFLQGGYKVAIGRRHPPFDKDHPDVGLEPEIKKVLFVTVDVASRESIQSAFYQVEAKLGVPNVVVYNAADLTFPANADDPFAISPADFEQDLAVNASGGYSALHHASRGFLRLKKEKKGSDSIPTLPCVFIATGNVTPFQPDPMATTLGSGKAALAYLVQVGMKAYEGKGIRFYFASQVTGEDKPVPYQEVSGLAHGEVYLNLVNRDLARNVWHIKFTANKDGTKARVEWETE